MRLAPEWTSIVVISMLLGLAGTLSAQERDSWMLTVDERIQRRQDPQNIQRRSFVIDGQKNPELFLPWELMDSLLMTATGHNELARATYRPWIALSGWDYDAFWQDLASRGRPHASAVEQSVAMQHRLISEGLPRTGQDLAALNRVICQARADALAGSRARYGATDFDRFLYVAVAPTLAVAAERPIDAATLRWLERGCR